MGWSRYRSHRILETIAIPVSFMLCEMGNLGKVLCAGIILSD